MVLITIVTGVYIQTYANIYANYATERQTETVAEHCSRAFDPYTFCHVRPAIEVYSCILMALFSCFPVLGLAGCRVGGLVGWLHMALSWPLRFLLLLQAGNSLAQVSQKICPSSPQGVHRSPTNASESHCPFCVVMGCSSKIKHG